MVLILSSNKRTKLDIIVVYWWTNFVIYVGITRLDELFDRYNYTKSEV